MTSQIYIKMLGLLWYHSEVKDASKVWYHQYDLNLNSPWHHICISIYLGYIDIKLMLHILVKFDIFFKMSTWLHHEIINLMQLAWCTVCINLISVKLIRSDVLTKTSIGSKYDINYWYNYFGAFVTSTWCQRNLI